MTRYYFDHAASAPRREDVSEAMARWQHGVVGNPAATHREAREARRAIEEARDEVAAFVGADPGGVIFTAGGTESCELAVLGRALHHSRHHATTTLVVSRIEHHAVLDAAALAARSLSGVSVRYVEVDADGVVDVASLVEVVDQTTALVSVMSANNETGAIQPLGAVSSGALAAAAGPVPVHTDAVAAAPWLHLPVVTATADMISICAHKLGGPVNAGALVLRGDVGLDPVQPGGGQERGLRGGTVDVAAAVGLAAAVRATARELTQLNDRVLELQRTLVGALSYLPGCRVSSSRVARVAGTVHATFEGVVSDELLFLLDEAGVAAGAGAACASGASQVSHVLSAMGVPAERARGALRLSMGPETSAQDVDALIGIVAEALRRLTN